MSKNPVQRWVEHSANLSTLQNNFFEHARKCSNSRQNGLVPNCCADLVLSVQSAKNQVDKNWMEVCEACNGVSTNFPSTMAKWVIECKKMGLTSWGDYKQRHGSSLPANPADVYPDFVNWDVAFGV